MWREKWFKSEACKLGDSSKVLMPVSLLIEVNATGTTLIQELQAAGVRYIEAMPAHRGNDRVTRTNGIADIFASGSVWAPLRCRWAQELVEEMASFPYGEADVFTMPPSGAAPHPARGLSDRHRREGRRIHAYAGAGV
jgi:predicted phage terminase large subunit-like protein